MTNFKPDSESTPNLSANASKPKTQPNNPLHGVKLADIVTELSEYYGWTYLGQEIKINCFTKDPSVKSSLKFLRKTQWARDKVEALYLDMQQQKKNGPYSAN